MISSLDDLRTLAAKLFAEPPPTFEPMAGGASSRRFWRFRAGGGSWVGVTGADPAETRAFLAFTRHFVERGIPVPRIAGEVPEAGLYIMEDLGSETLAQRLRRWRGTPGGGTRCREALERVVRWLPVIQVRGGAGLDYRLCLGGEEFGAAAFQEDIRLFLEWYLPHRAPETPPDARALAELEALAARLGSLDRTHFCYRDFQTRNVMWSGEGPVFIDYQSGRRGPLAYDLAALLYSPDSGLEEEERELLIDAYLEALRGCDVILERGSFLEALQAAVTVRRLQALGAYVRVAIQRRKPEYLDRIAPAWRGLRALLEGGLICRDAPALGAWLMRLSTRSSRAALTEEADRR